MSTLRQQHSLFNRGTLATYLYFDALRVIWSRDRVSRAVKQKEPKAYPTSDDSLRKGSRSVAPSTRTMYDDDQSEFSTFLSSVHGRMYVRMYVRSNSETKRGR